MPVTLLVLMAAIQSTVKEAPVNKTIIFSVYKSSNYTTEVYRNSFVQVQVMVEKVNGHKRSIVWEKTLDAKLLNLFPSFENALSQIITVPNVFNKKQHLEITYTLTYDSNGSKLQMQGDTVVSAGTNSRELKIGI